MIRTLSDCIGLVREKKTLTNVQATGYGDRVQMETRLISAVQRSDKCRYGLNWKMQNL